MTEMALERLPGTVLFVVPELHTNLAGAIRFLREAGCDVHVFARTRGKFEDGDVAIPRIFPPDAPPSEIRAAIRDVAPDLVFIRSGRPLSKVCGYFCRLQRIPAFAFGVVPLTRVSRLHRVLKRWIEGQPAIRVTPVPGADAAAKPDPFARFVPLPVEAAEPAGEAVSALPQRRPAGRLRIICSGKLSQPRKNQDRLIAALDALGRASDVSLTLVGASDAPASGSERNHLDALHARAALDDDAHCPVRILGDVPHARMPHLYARHDICVLPADAEPLGMAPLEAMAQGLVPVVSHECGCAGYLRDGENGFIVDPHDTAAFAGLLGRLVEDRDLVARIGASALETARGPLGREAFLSSIAALRAGGR